MTTPANSVATHCGVKQGSPDSAILFVATLGEQLRQLEMHWAQQGWGFVMGPVRINNTSFADDIVLMSDSPKMAHNMLDSLTQRLNTIGLKVNNTKTQCMSVPSMPSDLLPGKVDPDNSILSWEELLARRIVRTVIWTINSKSGCRNFGDSVAFFGKGPQYYLGFESSMQR